MRPAQLLTVLDREFLSAREGHHTPVMLWGPPGIGKSQIIAQVAVRHAAPMIDIRLSQMEPTDLRGIPFRIENRVEWAVPSMLPDAERHGPYGILFLDEITSAPPSVSAAAYQLILDRRLGDYEVPPGWAIFAAGNRQGDRGVTYAMPAPLANRFSHFEVGDELLFCRRDQQTAEDDLQRMLIAIGAQLNAPIRGGVYYSCLGRGQHMFGAPNREMELIRDTLGSFPLVGFFANGEISHNRLYGYTGVLTLFG